MSAQDQAEKVGKLIEIQPQLMGGGCIGWMFYDGERELIFGYANGALGYSYDPGTHEFEGDDMPNEDATAEDQAEFIRSVMRKLGFSKCLMEQNGNL